MKFFENIRDFYRHGVFTDLSIYASDNAGEKTSVPVCRCHLLVLTSAIPSLKNILTGSLVQGFDSHLVIHDGDPHEIVRIVDSIYDALVDGASHSSVFNSYQTLRAFNVAAQATTSQATHDLLGVPDLPEALLDDHINFPNLEHDLDEARRQVNCQTFHTEKQIIGELRSAGQLWPKVDDTTAFEDLEDLVEASLSSNPDKRVTGRLDHPYLQNYLRVLYPYLPYPGDAALRSDVLYVPNHHFVSLMAVGKRQSQNVASVITSRLHGKDQLRPDKMCANMIDVMLKLFGPPLSALFESQGLNLESHLDKDALVKEQMDLLPNVSLEQARLEQKIYNEIVSQPRTLGWKPIPVQQGSDDDQHQMTFAFIESYQLEDVYDMILVSGETVNNITIQSYFDKNEIGHLDFNDKTTIILDVMAAFCGFSSPSELMHIPLFKAMVETHFVKLCRGIAIDTLYPQMKGKEIKMTRTTSSGFKTEEEEEEDDDDDDDEDVKQEDFMNESPPLTQLVKKKSSKLGGLMPERKRGPKTKTESPILKCHHEGCGKLFKKKAGWRKHVNYFHLKEGSGVPCEECGIIYQNFFYLRIHKRQAHEEVNCKDCTKTFIGDNELGRHKRKVHLKGNEHICEVCGQGFKMRFYMKRHKRQHHPEAVNSPYYCKECNRYFGTNRKLRDHMVGAHFKTRPYKCRAGDHICDKAFYNVNLRRKHERQVHHLHIYTPSGTKSNKIVEILNDDHDGQVAVSVELETK
jgi:hypothetical protein